MTLRLIMITQMWISRKSELKRKRCDLNKISYSKIIHLIQAQNLKVENVLNSGTNM
jgi:hypothetical protein